MPAELTNAGEDKTPPKAIPNDLGTACRAGSSIVNIVFVASDLLPFWAIVRTARVKVPIGRSRPDKLV